MRNKYIRTALLVLLILTLLPLGQALSENSTKDGTSLDKHPIIQELREKYDLEISKDEGKESFTVKIKVLTPMCPPRMI